MPLSMWLYRSFCLWSTPGLGLQILIIMHKCESGPKEQGCGVHPQNALGFGPGSHVQFCDLAFWAKHRSGCQMSNFCISKNSTCTLHRTLCECYMFLTPYLKHNKYILRSTLPLGIFVFLFHFWNRKLKITARRTLTIMGSFWFPSQCPSFCWAWMEKMQWKLKRNPPWQCGPSPRHVVLICIFITYSCETCGASINTMNLSCRWLWYH